MAGMTTQGFSIKRQNEVLTDLRNAAHPIFQDLVPVGDVVDTSPSSTIGRLVGLVSDPYADLWQAMQEVYLAFDPNSATGIALDNLVQYMGLTRNPPSATTSLVVVWGDNGIFIPATTSQVRTTENGLYEIAIGTQLTPNECIGFSLDVPNTIVTGTVYGVDIVFNSTTISLRTTATPTSTKQTIRGLLYDQAYSYSEIITVNENSNLLNIESTDIFDYMRVVPVNTVVVKIKDRTEVRNTVVGEIPQEANTINRIATPILGWDSVNNPFVATTGRGLETDDELRLRFRFSKAVRGQNISDSLYSALLEIDGVVSAAIYENTSNIFNTDYDLPSHSFRVIILGGNPTEICQTIWRNQPTGISSVGNSSEIIFDNQDFPKTIEYDRPEPIDIYINMDIKVISSMFPANGEELIKSSLIEYFNDNFGIGNNVVYSRLFTPINSVVGHQVDSLTMGVTPSPTGNSNVVVPYNRISNLKTENITINIS